MKIENTSRTREKSFEDHWSEAERMLELSMHLEAKTLFEWLCRRHAIAYSEEQLRLFQDKVSLWRAQERPKKKDPVEIVEHAGKAYEFGPVIMAPEDPAEWGAWCEALVAWRKKTRAAMHYDDEMYLRSDLAWTSSCFTWNHVMLWDTRFMDAENGCFKVDELLDYGEKEFGGYDILVLWPDYPRIGIDDRNQFDHYRGVPGGLDGLRDVADRCHARGTKLFVAYKPWDTDTRREDVSEVDANVALVKRINADGMFLDTMSSAEAGHREKVDAARAGVAFAPESMRDRLDMIPSCNMELQIQVKPWAGGELPPAVLKNKWLEPRHQHFIDGHRPKLERSAKCHMAWMNGSGLFVWDNGFCMKVVWCPRDRSLIRSMMSVLRRYASLFSTEQWKPLVSTEDERIFAGLREENGLRLWTLTNKKEEQVEGTFLVVPHEENEHYYDLIAGREIEVTPRDGMVELKGSIRPRGIGGILAGTKDALGDGFDVFLAKQAEIDARADFTVDTVPPPEELKIVASTKKLAECDISLDAMVAVPGYDGEIEVSFRVRECLLYEPTTSEHREEIFRPHLEMSTLKKDVSISPYAVDLTPVTNQDYAKFMKASGYVPVHAENFLKHWKNGVPPEEKANHPVVYVGLADARAYAAWAGKRLPTEEEWQRAAGGEDDLEYPWGREFDSKFCNDGATGGTTSVDAFPRGRSPYGCYDMCGNVWELPESERHDGMTRFCILKGGSYYEVTGSQWYSDGGPQRCDFAGKYILFWAGLDRSPTIGFRCVVDMFT